MEGRVETGGGMERAHEKTSGRRGGEDRSRRPVLDRGKIFLYVVAATVLVAVPLAIAGCGGDISNPASGGLPGVAGSANTLTVSGQATVSSPPDEAVVVLTVENDAASASAAMDATSSQSQQMLDRLKSDGIPDSAIQTSSITLYPLRTYNPDTGKETLDGYRAQNSITVTVPDAPTVGKVLAAGIETGATLVSGPVWRLRDDGQAVNEALKQAVANARGKAESLAAAAGASLGEVLIMSEGSVQVPVPVYAAAEGLDSAKVIQPPVSSGNLDVTASVSVTYALER